MLLNGAGVKPHAKNARPPWQARGQTACSQPALRSRPWAIQNDPVIAMTEMACLRPSMMHRIIAQLIGLGARVSRETCAAILVGGFNVSSHNSRLMLLRTAAKLSPQQGYEGGCPLGVCFPYSGTQDPGIVGADPQCSASSVVCSCALGFRSPRAAATRSDPGVRGWRQCQLNYTRLSAIPDQLKPPYWNTPPKPHERGETVADQFSRNRPLGIEPISRKCQQ